MLKKIFLYSKVRATTLLFLAVLLLLSLGSLSFKITYFLHFSVHLFLSLSSSSPSLSLFFISFSLYSLSFHVAFFSSFLCLSFSYSLSFSFYLLLLNFFHFPIRRWRNKRRKKLRNKKILQVPFLMRPRPLLARHNKSENVWKRGFHKNLWMSLHMDWKRSICSAGTGPLKPFLELNFLEI